MKKFKNTKKKILSGIAVLAISATAVSGAISLAACGNKSFDYKPSETDLSRGVIATAVGDAPQLGGGKTYYVSPDGGDFGAADVDGSKEHPYKIEVFSNDEVNGFESKVQLQPGDTLYLLPGTYKPSRRIIFTDNGAFNKYIKVINAALDKEHSEYDGTDEKVTIDFSTTMICLDSNRGVQIYGDYYYWYGIDVAGAGDNGLFVAGSYNTIDYSEFYNNRDSGFQLGRESSDLNQISQWPSYNLVKNCTAHNNYDNEGTKGENADGFAAKLTIGYGNVFDGCIAYRNSDDGWDLYAYSSNGNIGTVIIYNCVAYENGFLEYTQKENNARFTRSGDSSYFDQFENGDSYLTEKGDGNGFKLGGSVMEGDVKLYNCLSFNNRMHGVTDNSNPGFIISEKVTSYDNGAQIFNDSSNSEKFGQVSDASAPTGDNATLHNNIDVARQTYSYNALNGVLSVTSGYGKAIGNDAYRGSVVDSILYAGSKSNVVSGSIDADTHSGGTSYTSQVNALSAKDIFTKLPITKDTDYTFDLSGKGDLGESENGVVTAYNTERAHKRFRNDDESINMGEFFQIKSGYNFDNTLGAGKTAGAKLDGQSWDAYTHYVDPNGVEADSAEKATVLKAKEALNVNADEKAVYQDFEVPAVMNGGVQITWTVEGDNSECLEVSPDLKVNNVNGASYATILVNRPIDADKQVTLRATLTLGTVTETKDFILTVKQGTPTVGRIYLIADEGETYEQTIDNGGSVIVDQYADFEEPTVYVENGIDYNGKLLKAANYDVTFSYTYASDKNSPKVPVKGFTPSRSGVFEVTVTATLKSEINAGAGNTNTMTYTIFIASPAANVDMVAGKNDIILNRDGFNLTGSLTNATGSVYAVTSATPLTLSGNQIKTVAGVQKYTFRGDTINHDFAAINNSSYYIYYALANANDEVTSQIYEVAITAIDVNTEDDFMKIAGGAELGSETVEHTIYKLTKDLNFSGKTYTVGSSAFMGLFNGNGKTVSNITVSGGSNIGVFGKAYNATIENIKFKGINITATGNKAGIIAEIHGGYVHNVQVLNSTINVTERVGILIGQVDRSKATGDLHVSQVYIDGQTKIVGSGNRVAGIIGFIQTSSTTIYNKIFVDDCLVSANITGTDNGVGGIVGEFDENGHPWELNITHCVFNGEAWVKNASTNKVAGIVGNQKGSQTMTITGCASLGKIYYGTESKIELLESAKNAAPIVGGDTADSTGIVKVRDCIAFFEEYDSNFNSSPYTVSQLQQPEMGVAAFRQLLGLSLSSWSLKYKEGSTTEIVSPFVELNFLDVD